MNTTRDQIDVESRKDPERLEREIDQKRDTIGNIVSALENKLSPGELIDRMMRSGKGSGAAEKASGAIEKGGVAGAVVLGTIGYGLGAMAKNVVHVARENPIPTLLASTGLVWLYAARQDSSPVRDSGVAYGRAYGTTRVAGTPSVYANRGEEYGSGESMRDKASHLRDKASERASDLREGASERAAHLKEGISERASHLREGASERASHLRESASHLRDSASYKLGNARERVGQTAHQAADTVRHQADRARQGFSHMMEENPLVVGAIALGIGALLGAALPTTRKEDELMGETGDKFRSKAGEAGQVMREKGREVAESVRAKGHEVAQEVREKGHEVAQEAREKGKEGAREMKDSSSSSAGGTQGVSSTTVRTGSGTPGMGVSPATPGGTSGTPRNTI